MPTSRLPIDIKLLLTESIDSVAHLEVLLMLFQNPTKLWDADAVGKELRSNRTAATIQLENLARQGFLKSTDSKNFRYETENQELNKKVEQLVQLYQEKPVAIISCIYERPTDKLKGFADAFKIKKD